TETDLISEGIATAFISLSLLTLLISTETDLISEGIATFREDTTSSCPPHFSDRLRIIGREKADRLAGANRV
ncbi:MAG: hypothetical protein Q7I89_04175, partial [Syntrophales bacterium]|nr:hypothetical protein [Syntrophales bacterium]